MSMKYVVTLTDGPGSPFPIKQTSHKGERYAIGEAQQLAAEYPDKYVYIEFYRNTDGQHGYLNPDGNYSITGKSWTNE